MGLPVPESKPSSVSARLPSHTVPDLSFENHLSKPSPMPPSAGPPHGQSARSMLRLVIPTVWRYDDRVARTTSRHCGISWTDSRKAANLAQHSEAAVEDCLQQSFPTGSPHLAPSERRLGHPRDWHEEHPPWRD